MSEEKENADEHGGFLAKLFGLSKPKKDSDETPRLPDAETINLGFEPTEDLAIDYSNVGKIKSAEPFFNPSLSTPQTESDYLPEDEELYDLLGVESAKELKSWIVPTESGDGLTDQDVDNLYQYLKSNIDDPELREEIRFKLATDANWIGAQMEILIKKKRLSSKSRFRKNS